MKIQDYINNVHKYKVDYTYQRPRGVWSPEDRQCLIDTILKSEPMPSFFVNFDSANGIYYVVDGQQRLDTISQFHQNKIKLNRKFSGDEEHGKTFNGDSPISDEQRSAFLNYDLRFWILEDYNDERVRMIFSRLQRGKPLTLGERLNAKPGSIVDRMREIAEHPFMKASIGVTKARYGNYPDAARILFYEKFGSKDMGTPALISFFDDNQTFKDSDKAFLNAISVLNYLAKCFPPDPGDYQYLQKHVWVMSVYTMLRELKVGYPLYGRENIIRKFIEDLHGKVYTEEFRRSNQKYEKFYENVRGGWSEKLISFRSNFLIKEYLDKYPEEELDMKRQISDEEKIAAFAAVGGKCENCGLQFKDYREPEYHHIVMYASGGKSEKENIKVLCIRCHARLRGKEEIKLPTEEEVSDDESEEYF
jgi:hypothetical protein